MLKLPIASSELRMTSHFDTTVERIEKSDLSKLKNFRFNWKSEFNNPDREIYGLSIVGQLEFLGLISLEQQEDIVFIYLIERKDYKKKKIYNGIGGNLFAFACKHSIESGCEGYVAFDAKTNLIDYYEKTLHAINTGSIRMGIEPADAFELVKKYYPGFM
jgi:hypothetical protein